ncbi:hypothetical protein LshimejAT787_3200130 [Lyophyllum shimeji]|uniref:Retrovirus-related Pol polyprotein from transposon TNT 1-94-like beta-barrel domain-containing protein n=1 Tax=Lyophyllum shimeji TaxID=47721 RepID=A0A9P3Q2X6_LYOSH|nr:hypothetical protein LshimejAT787_3200130 [Lyophyllum shimeji]
MTLPNVVMPNANKIGGDFRDVEGVMQKDSLEAFRQPCLEGDGATPTPGISERLLPRSSRPLSESRQAPRQTTDAHLALGAQMLSLSFNFNFNFNFNFKLASSGHMFFDRSYFTSYAPVSTRSEDDWISVGDARDIPGVGRGTVAFEARLPEGLKTVLLHNTLHVPKIAANLVSIGHYNVRSVIRS